MSPRRPRGARGIVQAVVAVALLAIATLLLAVVSDIRRVGERLHAQSRADNGAAAAASVQAWALDLNAVFNLTILGLHAVEAGVLLTGSAIAAGQFLSGVGAFAGVDTLAETADLVQDTWRLNVMAADTRDTLNQRVVPGLVVAAAFENARQGPQPGIIWPVSTRGSSSTREPPSTRDCVDRLLNPPPAADALLQIDEAVTAGIDLQVESLRPGEGLAALVLQWVGGRAGTRPDAADDAKGSTVRAQVALDEALEAWLADLGAAPWWPDLAQRLAARVPSPGSRFEPAVAAQCQVLRGGGDAAAWEDGAMRLRRMLAPISQLRLRDSTVLSTPLIDRLLPTRARGAGAQPSVEQAWNRLRREVDASGLVPFATIRSELRERVIAAAGAARVSAIVEDVRLVADASWLAEAWRHWRQSRGAARQDLTGRICDELNDWSAAIRGLRAYARDLAGQAVDAGVRAAIEVVQQRVAAAQQQAGRSGESDAGGVSLLERLVVRAFCRADDALFVAIGDVPMPTRLRDDFASSQVDAVWLPGRAGVQAVAQTRPWGNGNGLLPGETILWPGFAPRWMPVDVHRRVDILPERLGTFVDGLLQH